MSYIIGSKCVSVCDTACVDVCPVDCIYGPIDPMDTGTEVEELIKPRHITLVPQKDLLDWLCKKGFTPTKGARPMKRLIDTKIKKPISKLIVYNDVRDCEIVIGIDLETNEVKVNAKQNI